MDLKSKFLHFFILTLIICVPSYLNAQLVKHERILSFENNGDAAITNAINSSVSVSPVHYKDGHNSLRWDFEKGGKLVFNRDFIYQPNKPGDEDTYLSSFIGWVYNTEASDSALRFTFYKDGHECSSFSFNLGFRGWRAIWASFDRDMAGTPQEGMNRLEIIAPRYNGTLFLDHFITGVKVDSRHHTPDRQQPLVNYGVKSHWLKLLPNSLVEPDPAFMPSSITELMLKDMQTIEKRYVELIYTPSKLSEKELKTIGEEYAKYDIKYKDGIVTGTPIFFTYASFAFERLMPDWRNLYRRHGMEIKQYFDLMHRIAVAYNNASKEQDKDKLEEMFLNMYRHITDQGAVDGSGMGNISHYGYSFRGLFTSYLLMKDVLERAGYRKEAENTLRWYAMTNQIFVKQETTGINVDIFNTLAGAIMSSIVLIGDTELKAQYLNALQSWLSNGCSPAPGLEGGTKPDGAMFHHCNNYPAYADGALSGATEMIYILSRTSFAASEKAHASIKNSLLAMRFYSNKLHFPLSMSGRHPDGKGMLTPIHYGRMALAGTPDGEKAVDKDMGAAYLRLVSDVKIPIPKKNTQLAGRISSLGISAENDPQGNLALAYGCVSVQRRDNWSAVVRGFSRYFWAAEHYIGANLYGRYLAHGSIQIMTNREGGSVTPETGGWVEEGFDWSRIPGTTAIRLPLDQLKANVLNVDTFSGLEEMLLSDEAFAGGLSQEKANGVFAIKLHENDKYNGSHRARKSYHFFDGHIVCLGSEIENNNKDYDTETTVFQLAVKEDHDKIYWNTYERDNSGVWVDHLGTGYYVPVKNNSEARLSIGFPQKSRAQDTGMETSGDWVALTLNHGKAPLGGAYEYAVVPGVGQEVMRKFSKKVPYVVLRKDHQAHIVSHAPTGITSYALFEMPSGTLPGLLAEADNSCLVMIKEGRKEALLTVCNPDLAFYTGDSDDIYDNNGKRIERSVYSRSWIKNDSKTMPVTVTLKGEWKVAAENDACKVVYCSGGKTVLRFQCNDGASYDVRLVPLK